jgi:acyl carrier protein
MNVVLAVENDFDIQFDDVELPKLTSFSLIVAAVERHVQPE